MEGKLSLYCKKVPPWKKRYFVLTGQRLRCYNHQGGALVEDMDITKCSTKHIHPFLCGKSNSFQITTQSMFMVVSAISEQVMNQWIQCIQTASGRTIHENAECCLSPSSTRVYLASCNIQDDIHAVDVEKEIVDILLKNIRQANDKLITTIEIALKQGRSIPSGSVLMTIEEESLIGLQLSLIKDRFEYHLQENINYPSSSLSLQYLHVRRKSGMLRMMESDGMVHMLRMIPPTQIIRKKILNQYKEKICILNGDYFIFYAHKKTSNTILHLPSRKNYFYDPTNVKKQQIYLPTSTIKLVHKLLSGRDFCFLLSTESTCLLLQAENEQELIGWTSALTHAIQVANGNLDQDTKSTSISHHPIRRMTFDYGHVNSNSININDDNQSINRSDTTTLSSSSSSSIEEENNRNSYTTTDSNEENNRFSVTLNAQVNEILDLSDDKEEEIISYKVPEIIVDCTLAESVLFYQYNDKIIDSIRLIQSFHEQYEHDKMKDIELMKKNWEYYFSWALEPITKEYYIQLLNTCLSSKDATQLKKDVPRTSQWLSSCEGVKELSRDDLKKRLDNLHHILHAYISSCITEDPFRNEMEEMPSAYLQGMNGIAFVLLQALKDDEIVSFQYLTAIVEKVLPSIFINDSLGQDTLAQAGHFTQEIVSHHLPQLTALFDSVGLPVFLVAYKWFPTLFSDISLTSHSIQVPFHTLLCVWEICFLMGMEGVLLITLTFFSIAQSKLIALSTSSSICMAEDIGDCMNEILVHLSCPQFYNGLCQVLDTCKDVRLRKLRHQHLRQLRRMIQTQNTTRFSSSLIQALSQNTTTQEKHQLHHNTIKDLDTGETFQITASGQQLLPPTNSK